MLADPEIFEAFDNCLQADGGEECIRNIPAGLQCLNYGSI